MGTRRRPITLAVDIGGSGTKAMLLDARGRPASEREREKTPRPSTPGRVIAVVREFATRLPGFHRVSIGFPGVVVDGVVRTAVNLHPAWIGVNLEKRLKALLTTPVRVANDADVQGLGIVEGAGVELVVTLGTGVGSALFLEGRLIPNLELGHHPFRKGRTYEQALGDKTLRRIGKKTWRHRVRLALDLLVRTFNCRRLYVGGGNARLLSGPLPRNVIVASNVAGLLGGIRLWDQTDPTGQRAPRPTSRSRARPRR
jgi:polyphosphate glucokinase